MFLGSENLIEWDIWRRPTEASFPQAEVLNFRFGAWCLVCNRFSSEERKERKKEWRVDSEEFQETDLSKKQQEKVFEKMAKTHQPKHNKSSKKKTKKTPSSLVERQNSNAFFFFFACSPSELKQVNQKKTSDKIIKGISLENQACKSSQLSVGRGWQFNLWIQTNSSSFSEPCYLLFNTSPTPSSWRGSIKRKKSKYFTQEFGLSGKGFFPPFLSKVIFPIQ